MRDGGGSASNAFVANMIEEQVGPKFTYAILEYCSGGSLQRRLQKYQKSGRLVGLPEVEASVLAGQVNAALCHLHSLDVAHRDVKPANVLFHSSSQVKLCDFGFAKQCRAGQRLWTLCGTPTYMAPEIIAQTRNGYLGRPVDM